MWETLARRAAAAYPAGPANLGELVDFAADEIYPAGRPTRREPGRPVLREVRVTIVEDPAEDRAAAAPAPAAPARGRKSRPVWALIEARALDWLAEYGAPLAGSGQLAEFEDFIKALVERHGEEAGEATIRRRAHHYITKHKNEP